MELYENKEIFKNKVKCLKKKQSLDKKTITVDSLLDEKFITNHYKTN